MRDTGFGDARPACARRNLSGAPPVDEPIDRPSRVLPLSQHWERGRGVRAEMSESNPRANGAPRRVLITGGAGFLGINLARFLLERGVAVASLDVADFGYPDVRGRVTAVRGDIRDREAIARALKGC